jgi:hypothetical protein
MQREALREWLKREPFHPFRVHLTDGRTYDVRYPRMNLLAQTFIKFGIPMPGSTNPIVCDYTEYVRLDEITHLEPLTETSTASTLPAPPLAPDHRAPL